MGLDMYAFSTEEAIPATDFARTKDSAEFFSWRKHPNLHGWMERLYRAKGGNADDFNCVTLLLDPADIDALEADVLADRLPPTEGFFFGVTRPEEKHLDLEFIAKAREWFEQGEYVFYDSWW